MPVSSAVYEMPSAFFIGHVLLKLYELFNKIWIYNPDMEVYVMYIMAL